MILIKKEGKGVAFVTDGGLKPKRRLLPYQTSVLHFVAAVAHLALIPRSYPSQVDCLWSSTRVSIAA